MLPALLEDNLTALSHPRLRLTQIVHRHGLLAQLPRKPGDTTPRNRRRNARSLPNV